VFILRYRDKGHQKKEKYKESKPKGAVNKKKLKKGNHAREEKVGGKKIKTKEA